MRNDPFEIFALLILVAVSTFLVFLIGHCLIRWLHAEWRLSGFRAFERMRKRLAKRQERERYQDEMRDWARESHLARWGRKLIAHMSDQFHTAAEMMSELRAVRISLGNYGTACFRTLQCLAGSCDGLMYPAYQVADLAPDRRQTQLQVLGVASAGLELLERIQRDVVLDSALVVWRLNLRKIRFEVCPNCPVVTHPEQYTTCCPVIKMAREEKDHAEE